MMYKFAQFDPRPIPTAQEANDLIFENGTGVLGVEVTVPALAQRCALGNIDPQHSGGNAEQAAIEAALTASMPPVGSTLATVRADIDSVGAMAVIVMRREAAEVAFAERGAGSLIDDVDHNWVPGDEILGRVRLVAEADTFARGEWPGQRPLPTVENPWPQKGGAAETVELAAMAAVASDFKLPLAERVALMCDWLRTGSEPAQYRERVQQERMDMVRALKSGEITWFPDTEAGIVVVTSNHRDAMAVGYCLAPIVVAINPTFSFAGGEPHRKVTIAAYSRKWADIEAALVELDALEPGWGGSPTIGGSPQGVSSTLSVMQILGVLGRHVTWR